MKDPLNNVGFVMSTAMSRLRKSNPKLTQKLPEFVHPSFAVSVEVYFSATPIHPEEIRTYMLKSPRHTKPRDDTAIFFVLYWVPPKI